MPQLDKYKQKRDFKNSPEPKYSHPSKTKKNNLLFVVQKHAASHLHYDFRLEVDGVLKSWAVPKGPSMNPNDKRLAIEVEDHPFDYRTFEGIIPEGNYGAGTVMVWDDGTYTVPEATSRKDTEKLMREGLEKGSLHFILDGHKLKGEFSLVKMKVPNQKNQWLLIKKDDGYSEPNHDVLLQDRSVQSNRTMDEIAHNIKHNPKHTEKSKKEKKSKLESYQHLKKGSMPHHVKPMLATLVDKPFDQKDWIFEIKWDGYRALAEIDEGNVLLYSRNQQSFNERFSPITQALKTIKNRTVLDGEIVALTPEGRPSFQFLQNYQKAHQGALVYYVFDILYLDGYDLRPLPLIQRKEILKNILPSSPHIQYCEHIESKGILFFQEATKLQLEGIIAKEKNSPYVERRSRSWLKIKTHLRQEAIICGFTKPRRSRTYFGALLLGVYENKKLKYIGHTGSGFNQDQLESIHKRLTPLIQSKCPFSITPKTNEPATWVKPQIVCEISFAEWTKDDLMRQAIFMGLRDDKNPKEVIKEETNTIDQAINDPPPKKESKKQLRKNVNKESVPFTNLDKVFWPVEGYTKGDLIEYYRQVSPYILPYLIDRPETLKRFPNGINKPSFFQKDLQHPPEWIKTQTIKHEDRNVNYLVIENEESLLYMVNLGCIEAHPFSSRIQSLLYPDYMIFDLDPQEIHFDEVVRIANFLHKTLKKFKIPCACKTSGGRGLHVFVPMGAKYTYEQVTQFSKLIAMFVEKEMPDIVSLERNPKKRLKQVYIDYLRNTFGQTLASAYCVRPKPGAPVSTPLKWTEVKAGLNPQDFTIKTVLKRFKKIDDPFKLALGPGIDLSQPLTQLSQLLK